MKREKPATGYELDDIQMMIKQMAQEMPEVKEQLSKLEMDIKPPSSLNRPPIPQQTWFERLGSWAIRPSERLPEIFAAKGDALTTTLLPLLLGGSLTPAMVFLLWWLI